MPTRWGAGPHAGHADEFDAVPAEGKRAAAIDNETPPLLLPPLAHVIEKRSSRYALAEFLLDFRDGIHGI